MYSNQFPLTKPTLIAEPRISLLMGDCSVRAGFPSPAEDFGGQRVDIASLVAAHPQATFLLRVAGDSMRDEHIFDRDVVVVSRALPKRHGQIVVATVDGEFTVKKLYKVAGYMKLQAGNPTYPDIVPKEGETIEVWGVVTHAIRTFRT